MSNLSLATIATVASLVGSILGGGIWVGSIQAEQTNHARRLVDSERKIEQFVEMKSDIAAIKAILKRIEEGR